VVTLTVVAALSSCGPRISTLPDMARSQPDAASLLDAAEQRVAEAIERVRGSALALEYSAADAPNGTRRVASGVVINDQGDVLSVRIDPPASASEIVARDASGRFLPARWVATDPETGLTLLRIPPGSARSAVAAPIGPKLGIPVLVVGNPFGLGHSVSRGSVSGLNRRVDLIPHPLGGLIQIDAALHPGDSGALLADFRGGWLGVVRSGLVTTAEGDREREYDHDLGFAIPAGDALWIAEQLRDRGRVERAYLGVTMGRTPGQPWPESDGDGARLDGVLAETPAARAGLKAGDRVVAFDGRPVHSTLELTNRLDFTSAGSRVTVEFVRGAGPHREVRRVTLDTARRPVFEAQRPSPKP
jgi:S1-C subfamily serine protease